MKLHYPIAAALLLGLWLLLGSTTGVFGTPLPALGKFFNPVGGFWRNAASPTLSRAQISEVRTEAGHLGTIFFDDRGVPHIFADDLKAAAYLQGYVHAADRRWQMDVSTRATEGTLSEVLGNRTLERDQEQVRLGYRWSARRETELLRTDFPDEYAILEAYAAGVNDYSATLKPATLPVEYKLLNHEPQTWSPYRTVLLIKGMSQSLSGNFFDDAERVATRQALTPEVYQLLFPKHLPEEEPVVPDAALAKGKRPGEAATLLTPTGKIQSLTATASPTHPAPAASQTLTASTQRTTSDHAYTLMPPHPGNGSNNWAVNARRSNTGYPMLASDPHLALTLPSIWYEVQIHLPQTNARGVSLPGAPGIMIGYNDYVAYGETNVGQDVTDWFKIDWVDSTRTEYRLDGKVVAAKIRTDTIAVAGEKDVILQTPYTVFGPVPYTDGPYADHAMRYLAHDVVGKDLRSHSTVGAFLRLMQAEDYTDYEEALRGHVDPAQNFVYADRYDNIAIRPNGFFPVRGSGADGGTPFPGDSEAYNWQGYVPFERRPVHYNPARNYVSSANQISTGPNYPYPYTGKFDEYRGRFINRHIEREGVLNQRAMKELQLNSYSLQAEELTPLLLTRLNRSQLTDESARLFRLIADWNYRYEGESRAATLFEAWKKKVYRLTFDELNPKEGDFLQPDVRVWTELIRRDPRHPIFDIDTTANFKETAATLVQRAFDELAEDYEGTLPEPWAEARNSRVRHLGAIPGFGSKLIRTGGGRSSPRVLIGNHGASWRMVVELGKHPRAWGSLPGGASGQAGSEAYDNGLDDWINGRYHELVRWRDWEEAENKSVGRWEFNLPLEER